MHTIDSLRRAAKAAPKAPEPYVLRTPEGSTALVTPVGNDQRGSLRPWCPKCGLSIVEMDEGCYRCGLTLSDPNNDKKTNMGVK